MPALVGRNRAIFGRKGVPEYLVINGVLARLLKGFDGQPLLGRDGQFLYGKGT